jgi:hypothetical protein
VAVLGVVVASAGVAAAPSAMADGGTAAVAFDGESGVLTGASESGGATVQSGSARRGTGGLRIAATGAPGYARWGTTVVPQGHTWASVRAWVRVTSRAAGESVDLLTIQNTQGIAHFDFFVNGVNQRFQWDLWRDDAGQSAFTVVYDRWYLVEAQVEFDGTVHSADVRIDGVPQTSIASAGDPSAVRHFTVGSTGAKTHVQHYDDIELRVGDSRIGWLADTPPTVALTRPANGATYGDGQVVSADFACGETDHTVASCSGTVADGAAIDTSTPGTYPFTVTATDAAGYRTTRTVNYTVVDDDDPAVVVAAPLDGTIVTRGTPLVADFACQDDAGGPPLDAGRCVGDVADGQPVDTSVAGDHDFTVTATDVAGNQTSWSGTYTVVANRPDAQIRPNTVARFAGDGVYNGTGTNQTALGLGTTTYLVRLQNDARAADTLRVKGGRARPGWTVRYYAGSREVTAAVHAGTYQVRRLPAGGSRLLRIVVRPKPGSRAGRQDVSVTVAAGGRRDTVRAITGRR